MRLYGADGQPASNEIVLPMEPAWARRYDPLGQPSNACRWRRAPRLLAATP